MSDIDALGTATISSFVRLKHLLALYTLVENVVVSNPLLDVDAKVILLFFHRVSDAFYVYVCMYSTRSL